LDNAEHRGHACRDNGGTPRRIGKLNHDGRSPNLRGRIGRHVYLAAAALIALVLTACNQAVQAPQDVARIDPTEVRLLSESGDQVALQAQTVSGVVEIQMPERDDVIDVEIYVDDLPTAEGAEPLTQASVSPFRWSIDTTTLEDGSHTVVFKVTFRGKRGTETQLVKVGFKVRNGDRTANKAPRVRAGPNQSTTVGTDLKIRGSVSDDGRPRDGRLEVRWTTERGPAEASFRDADQAQTLVSFPVAGRYVLRLTASDGQKSASDTVRVTVTAPPAQNAAPTVDAGRDLLVTLPNSAKLSGVASDDGLPTGRLDLTWSVVSGPGSVTFADANEGTTTADFSTSGTYVLELSATDGDLTSTDALTVVVEPEPVEPGTPTDPEPSDPEPTEPEPTDPEPTDPKPTDPKPSDPEPTDPEPTDPVPPVRGDLEMVGDPSFKASSLPSETRVWYDRFLAALNNSSQYPNVMSAARSGDIYKIGRTVNVDVTTTLNVFRLTGDLQLLDHVDEVMQAARAELRDTNGDGYLNWRWLHSSSETAWYGDDKHVMDEIMTHGLVAQVAWAFEQNRDLKSPNGVDYRERADFWSDYLRDWESKWRARNRKSSGFPFISKHLTHPHLNLLRFHWYSYRLTGNDGYLKEARRMAAEMNDSQFSAISTPNGTGYVFPHGVVKYSSHDYLAPLNYAGYSTQVLMDLAFEPFEEFSREATLVPLANTIATKVIDNGSRDFAPTIGGSKAIGGYGLSSGSRATVEQWAIWPIGEYAAFDESGTIRSINQQVYDKLERSSERPTRAGIPAAMVIAGLLGN